ncbi:MAG: hypothetical protein Q8R11_02340 [bacterium]|nr:hypothetical protein [bacterium]
MDTQTAQSPKLQQILAILQQKGWTDDQLAQLTTDLTKAAFSKLYSEAMTSFTEEDLQAIEACADQVAANVEIQKRYQMRTGRDAQADMQQFLDTFAQGFMEEYEKEKFKVQSSNVK